MIQKGEQIEGAKRAIHRRRAADACTQRETGKEQARNRRGFRGRHSFAGVPAERVGPRGGFHKKPAMAGLLTEGVGSA